MNRRKFLVESTAALVTLIGTPVSIAFAQENEQEAVINEFVRELSRYDIIHFGEGHQVRNFRETTTLEDFVDLLLPKFRDTSLVQKPYDTIRAEVLPNELDMEGNQYIPKDELVFFDEAGIINRIKTPTFFFEILGYGAVKEPHGTLKIAREGTLMGYKVRGIHPSIKLLEALRQKALQHGEDFVDFILALAIDRSYLPTVKRSVENGERVIVYGGGLHNDSSDPVGAGNEMKREFGRKYVAVDLVKPSVVNIAGPYFQHYRKIFNDRGIDPFNITKVEILKLEGDLRADYFVLLPKRMNKL